MKILITGHTGFKGSWLSFLLHALGHKITGISLDPLTDSMYNYANVQKVLHEDIRLDIRSNELKKVIKKIEPEVIFHLAAQPLVLKSLINSRETVDINVMGTLNLLETAKELQSLKTILIITTDKVYKNKEQGKYFNEEDALGGDDPYSSSKAMSDLLAQSYAKSFNMAPISILRAGNVIGGGDFSENRIVPDLYRAITSNNQINVRNPTSIRPWEHVLDCLNGYVQAMTNSIESKRHTIYNFGPNNHSYRTVIDLVNKFNALHGEKLKINNINEDLGIEKNELRLDINKAKQELNWKPLLGFDETIEWTHEWYKALLVNLNMFEFTTYQVNKYLDLNQNQNN